MKTYDGQQDECVKLSLEESGQFINLADLLMKGAPIQEIQQCSERLVEIQDPPPSQ